MIRNRWIYELPMKAISAGVAILEAACFTMWAGNMPMEMVEREPELETVEEYRVEAMAEAAMEEDPVLTAEAVAMPVEYRECRGGIYEGDSFFGTLTFYDICPECCGKTDGVTASGLVLKNEVRPETPVAACNWLPLGTVITVDGVEHLVADRGGKLLDTVGWVDIFNPAGHADSLERGIVYGAEIVIMEFPPDESVTK